MSTTSNNTSGDNPSKEPIQGNRGHPIAVVAERTGLSRDVLRVWERRYRAVEPQRSAGGQRVYSDQQIERFRLLASATRHGRNISLVASLSNEQLLQLIADDDMAAQTVSSTETPVPTSAQTLSPRPPSHIRDDKPGQHLTEIVNALLTFTEGYDSASVDRVLRRTIAERGLLCVLDDVIPPFMRGIGEAWMAERFTIAHEHMACTTVMSVLFDTIRTAPVQSDAPRILIATPTGEQHGIGAALVAATAALDGWSIVYLGVDVPAHEISAAADAINADVVGLSAVYAPDPTQLTRDVATIRGALAPRVSLIVGGSAALAYGDALHAAGATVCTSLHAFRSELFNARPS